MTRSQIANLWYEVVEEHGGWPAQPDTMTVAATVAEFARRVEALTEALTLERAAQECEQRAEAKDGSAEHYVRSYDPSVNIPP